jgi:acetylornithine deacetylase/succinyl-diaminopimelate desuccinylase-like protein
MKPQKLTMNSEALERFRSNLDAALNMMINQMRAKNLLEGTTTAKLNVLMVPGTDEETGEIFYKMEIEPQIDVKIGAKAKIECPVTAGIFAQFDKDGTVVVASNQISMDELMEEDKHDTERAD